MSWKEDKAKQEWTEKEFKISKRPITETKSVFHVYYKDKYIAYCKSFEEAQKAAKDYKVK